MYFGEAEGLSYGSRIVNYPVSCKYPTFIMDQTLKVIDQPDHVTVFL